MEIRVSAPLSPPARQPTATQLPQFNSFSSLAGVPEFQAARVASPEGSCARSDSRWMETRRRARTRGVSMAVPSSLLHLSTILGALFNTAAPGNRRVVHQATRALFNLVDHLFNMRDPATNWGTEEDICIGLGDKEEVSDGNIAQMRKCVLFVFMLYLAFCHLRAEVSSSLNPVEFFSSSVLCCSFKLFCGLVLICIDAT